MRSPGVTSAIELMAPARENNSKGATHKCSIKSRVVDINVIEPH